MMKKIMCLVITILFFVPFLVQAEWKKIDDFRYGKEGSGIVYQHQTEKEVFKVISKPWKKMNYSDPFYYKWYGSHFKLQIPGIRIFGVQNRTLECENVGSDNSKYPNFDHWKCYATDSQFLGRINDIKSGGFYTKQGYDEDDEYSRMFAIFEKGESPDNVPDAFLNNKETEIIQEEETVTDNKTTDLFQNKKDDRVIVREHTGGCRLVVLNETPDDMKIVTNGFERGILPKRSRMVIKGLNCDFVDFEAFAQGINFRKTFHKTMTFQDRHGKQWGIKLQY